MHLELIPRTKNLCVAVSPYIGELFNEHTHRGIIVSSEILLTKPYLDHGFESRTNVYVNKLVIRGR